MAKKWRSLQPMVELNYMSVSATTDSDLQTDDITQLAWLR